MSHDPAPGVTFFATAAKGTEGALRDELRELGLRGVKADRGGVAFTGGWRDGWRACLGSRVAMRVLAEVGSYPATDAASLYEGARGVEWERHVSSRTTIAVSVVGTTPALVHTGFSAQRVKDAIVDRVRDREGARPSVDGDDPDVRVFARLKGGGATVYLDLAGAPLFQRGWRAASAEAPLKETLAAAVLRLSGWTIDQPLFDPMCGSGTILIEAALASRRIAPGLFRARFGFERWASHGPEDAREVAALRAALDAEITADAPPIAGCDADASAVAAAEENARRARVKVALSARPLSLARAPTTQGHVVTNPPYGKRLSRGAGLGDDLGDAMRRHGGHAFGVLTADDATLQGTGRAWDRAFELFNGDLRCRLALFGPVGGPGGGPRPRRIVR
ncbi:MAG: RNA methyltransferase [Polyangiaceae bacterium]|nr:RNA methyltransferase [Polyangiaceae bacterium]